MPEFLGKQRTSTSKAFLDHQLENENHLYHALPTSQLIMGGKTHGGECSRGLLSERQLGEAAPGTECQIREIKGPSGRKEEGTEGQLATYGLSLGLLPKGIFIWEHQDSAPWIIKIQKYLHYPPLGNQSPKEKYFEH